MNKLKPGEKIYNQEGEELIFLGWYNATEITVFNLKNKIFTQYTPSTNYIYHGTKIEPLCVYVVGEIYLDKYGIKYIVCKHEEKYFFIDLSGTRVGHVYNSLEEMTIKNICTQEYLGDLKDFIKVS